MSDSATRHDAERTLLRFFQSIDDQNYSEVGLLLAEEGVWMRRGAPVKGPHGVMQSLRDVPPVQPTLHIITNMICHFSAPTQVSATFYLTAYRSAAAQGTSPPWRMEPPHSIAAYAAKLSFAAETWRIVDLRSRRIFQR